MFDSLAEKLQDTLSGVRQRGALTEEDIAKAMREIRLALLEADVNFKVVKQFTNAVKERAVGEKLHEQLNPGQQVVKIVDEELTALMGGHSAGLTFSPRPPTVILMAGLDRRGRRPRLPDPPQRRPARDRDGHGRPALRGLLRQLRRRRLRRDGQGQRRVSGGYRALSHGHGPRVRAGAV